MVQISQTEDEIKITIELNRLLNRRPDIVLLPTYLKFNNPPIFFERHLTDEIDESISYCKIFKREARIVLVKKNKGIWPEIFQNLSKDELSRKRVEMSDQLIEWNKERDKECLERFDKKRRDEIDKEVRRETDVRQRFESFEKDSCKQAMMVGVKKETCVKPQVEKKPEQRRVQSASVDTLRPRTRPPPPVQIRATGKISFNFSNFNAKTPKRESQAPIQQPTQLPPQGASSNDGVD